MLTLSAVLLLVMLPSVRVAEVNNIQTRLASSLVSSLSVAEQKNIMAAARSSFAGANCPPSPSDSDE